MSGRRRAASLRAGAIAALVLSAACSDDGVHETVVDTERALEAYRETGDAAAFRAWFRDPHGCEKAQSITLGQWGIERPDEMRRLATALGDPDGVVLACVVGWGAVDGALGTPTPLDAAMRDGSRHGRIAVAAARGTELPGADACEPALDAWMTAVREGRRTQPPSAPDRAP